MTGLCEVCKEIVSKYKCSVCFIPYCSLSCWKQHKSKDDCVVKENPPEKNDLMNVTDKNKYFTEDTIREEKLRQLGDSETLKKILSSRYLQSTLIQVNNASNPEEAIKQAMKCPNFVEFVDECLRIVEDS